MLEWAALNNISGIDFFYANKDVAKHLKGLTEWFSFVQTVPGTRSHHRFIPLSENKLKMFHLSENDSGTVVTLLDKPDIATISSDNLRPGQLFAVVYASS